MFSFSTVAQIKPVRHRSSPIDLSVPCSLLVSFRFDPIVAVFAAVSVALSITFVVAAVSIVQCARSDGLLELLPPIFTVVQFHLSAAPAAVEAPPSMQAPMPLPLWSTCSQTPGEGEEELGTAMPKRTQTTPISRPLMLGDNVVFCMALLKNDSHAREFD